MKNRIDLPEGEILRRLNAMCPGTLMETFGIEYTEAGEKKPFMLVQTVGDNMMRPGGIVHGGATMALIETVGSSAFAAFHGPGERSGARDRTYSANHVSTGRKGDVLTATAKAIHTGRSTQLWQVKVVNQDGRLISHGKVTNIVMPKEVLG